MLRYFTEFRANYYQAIAQDKQPPKLDPPVPDIKGGLRCLFQVREKLFKEGTFRDNLRQTYINCGMRKTFASTLPGGKAMLSPFFIQFTDKSKGTMCTGRGRNHAKKKKPTSDMPVDLSAMGSDISLGGMLLNIEKRPRGEYNE